MNNRREGFTGVWFPAHIWELIGDDRYNLGMRDLLVWGEVSSFRDGCFLTNEKLGERLGCSANWISQTISNLKNAGLLRVEVDGTTRVLDAIGRDEKLPKSVKKRLEKASQRVLENSKAAFDKTQTLETGVTTGVREYNIDIHHQQQKGPAKNPSDSVLKSTSEASGETTDGGAGGGRMKPEVLLTKIRVGFGVRQNIERKARAEAVAMLQEEFPDDVILEAVQVAKDMADSRFSDGGKWKVDYLWFTSTAKHLKVCDFIEKASIGGVKMRWEDVGE